MESKREGRMEFLCVARDSVQHLFGTFALYCLMNAFYFVSKAARIRAQHFISHFIPLALAKCRVQVLWG